MKDWEKFEIQCTDYLNNRFGAYAQFFHQGGPDSTVPDILVKTNSGNSFYIEAKDAPAQCGQFVLLEDHEAKRFNYSDSNKSHINKYAEVIMNYMNDDFDKFKEASTSGEDINMPNGADIFAGWIIQTYKDKGADFFITNDNTILPIERFKEYFDVSAKYRIKRSGSSSVGKKYLESVIDYISTHDYGITNYRADGAKLFVMSSQQLHNHRFTLDEREYMFSARGNEYELRKISGTNNANVIFRIERKAAARGISDSEFTDYLK